jgi:succinate dehydrogenase/fumarate reductase flavoprotein subunit
MRATATAWPTTRAPSCPASSASRSIPLIKDYNGPACAYVTGPFGGHTTNSKGERFIECDYWSGQMMQEFYNELQGGNGPVFLKLNHLAEETIQTIETILHTNERPEPRALP